MNSSSYNDSDEVLIKDKDSISNDSDEVLIKDKETLSNDSDEVLIKDKETFSSPPSSNDLDLQTVISLPSSEEEQIASDWNYWSYRKSAKIMLSINILTISIYTFLLSGWYCLWMIPNLIPLYIIPWNVQRYNLRERIHITHHLYETVKMHLNGKKLSQGWGDYRYLIMYRYWSLCETLIRFLVFVIYWNGGSNQHDSVEDFVLFMMIFFPIITGVLVWEFTQSVFRRALHHSIDDSINI